MIRMTSRLVAGLWAWAIFAYTSDSLLRAELLYRILALLVPHWRQEAHHGTPGPRFAVRAFGNGERGQALAEEGLILALIAIVSIGALTAIGVNISDTLGQVAGTFSWLAPDTSRSRG